MWLNLSSPTGHIFKKSKTFCSHYRHLKLRSDFDWGGNYRENVSSDPVTWSWTTLFHMYALAANSEAKEMHDSILEIIQIKRCIKYPRYNFPDATSYQFIDGNTELRNSPLGRMLNVWHQQDPINRREGDPLPQNSYPSWFTGVDNALAMRQRDACACRKCQSTTEACPNKTQHEEDEVMDLSHVWCHWHEHTAGEKKACLERFDKMDQEKKFRDNPPEREAKAEEKGLSRADLWEKEMQKKKNTWSSGSKDGGKKVEDQKKSTLNQSRLAGAKVEGDGEEEL